MAGWVGGWVVFVKIKDQQGRSILKSLLEILLNFNDLELGVNHNLSNFKIFLLISPADP